MIVHIDITSDLACPWCYVGWKRLKRGLETFRRRRDDVTFEVTDTRPFSLFFLIYRVTLVTQ